jgi:hypothetical protein
MVGNTRIGQEPCPNCKDRPPRCLACHRKRVAKALPWRRQGKSTRQLPQSAKRDWQRPLDR